MKVETDSLLCPEFRTNSSGAAEGRTRAHGSDSQLSNRAAIQVSKSPKFSAKNQRLPQAQLPVAGGSCNALQNNRPQSDACPPVTIRFMALLWCIIKWFIAASFDTPRRI